MSAATATAPPSRARRRPGGTARNYVGAGLVVGLAVALTVAAGTRPSFDAYGWLDWGHMTLHGGLDTNAAPSFKPLPYVFTLVYGLLGEGAATWLWMFTATAVSLAGVLLAGRLARTLCATGGGRGWAGWVAAVLAGVALLAVHDELHYDYVHYILSSQSDPMIVACVLGAADCQLRGRPRAAFWLLVAASLGRPEAWPLLVADGAWLWRGAPGCRAMVVAGLAAVGLLWFGIPALSSRSWLIAADNADASGFGPTGNKALGVLERWAMQAPWPLWAAAAAAVGVAVRRRETLALWLIAGVVVWMAIEVAFGLHGWPALGRYMFEPTAVVIVLGASLIGRLLSGALARPGGRAIGTGARLAAGVVAVVLIAAVVPRLVSEGRAEHSDLVAQHARTRSLQALSATIGRLGGGARLRRCGEVISVGLETQTVLAYDVGENVNRVGYKYPQPGHPHNPIVVFRPRGSGWTVRARRQRAPGCRGLGVD